MSAFSTAMKRGAEVDAEVNKADSVDTADIADSAVTNAKIADAVVANAKLAVPKVVVYQETFAYGDMTDGGGAAATFDLSHSIPAGADFLKTTIHALTGFTGDTSAVITVGDGTDVDRYNTGTPNVFTTAAAGVAMGAPSGTTFHAAAKTPKVTITSNADWGSVSAGQVTVTLFYYRPV